MKIQESDIPAMPEPEGKSAEGKSVELYTGCTVDESVVRPAVPNVIEKTAGDVNFNIQLLTSTDQLSKSFKLNEAGDSIEKIAHGNMTIGRITTFSISLKDLPRILQAIKSTQALCISNTKFEDGTEITLKGNEKEGSISRSGEFLPYEEGAAVIVLDMDTCKYYQPANVEKMLSDAKTIIPSLSKAALVIKASNSAEITCKINPAISNNSSGLHVYAVIRNAGLLNGEKLKELRDLTLARAWLAGKGYIKISKSGTPLPRCPIDVAVFSPERLVFEGAPVLSDDLEKTESLAVYTDGSFLDVDAMLKPLTSAEERKYKAMVEVEKRRLKPEIDRIKNEYLEAEVEKLTNKGKHIEIAQSTVQSRMNGELSEDDILDFEEFGEVTVAEVLSDIDKYDKEAVRDPLRPEKGYGKGKLYANKSSGRPILHSFVDEVNYILVKSDKEETKKESTFTFVSSTELTKEQRSTSWQILGIMENNSLALIFGEPACGKSLIALDMAFCVSTGLDWHGKMVKKSPVVYIAGEGFNGLSKRLKALEAKYGITAPELYISKAPASLSDSTNAIAVMEGIKVVCDNAGLIIIDTLHRNFGGADENSAQDLAAFLNNIDIHLRADGATTLIVHHSGHGDKTRSRGSSAIKAAMDVEYKVTKKDNLIEIKNTKAKDIERPKPLTFKIKAMPIDWQDEIGQIMEVPVLEASVNTINHSKKTLSHRDEVVLKALSNALISNPIKSTPDMIIENFELGGGKPVVNKETWMKEALQLIDVKNDSDIKKMNEAKRKAFDRSREKLLDMGEIKNYDNYYWRIDEAD